MFGRRNLRAAIASAIVLAGSGIGLNAYAVDNTASATVVKPITIVAANALRFGSFSSPANSGSTVKVGADDSRILGSGVLGVGTTQNAFGAASFTVSGENDLAYTVTLPTADVTLLRSGTTTNEHMTVAFGSFSTNLTSLSEGKLSASGTQTLKVGATLSTTMANQTAGTYSGTFAVTVAYN